MNPIRSIQSFFAWSRPIREVYGLTTGLRIAMQLRQAMWAARPGGVVHVSVPDLPWPLALRTGTSDAAVFLQVFIQRQGFFPVDGEPEFIVDAGANIGLASACLAGRFPRSAIVSMEIDGSNYSALLENARHYPRITPMRVGLWSHTTALAIANPDAESWAFRTIEVDVNTPGAIPAMGIEDLLQRFGRARIDVLKIDVEGAEYDLFSSDISSTLPCPEYIGLTGASQHDGKVSGHIRPHL